MDASETHLERALEEYNDKVNRLESDGPSIELLEALINRGSVLFLLEYYTSAREDIESAIELMDVLESEGKNINEGSFVKAHCTLAQIRLYQGEDPSSEYRIASTRLASLNEESNHFDFRSIMNLCLDASEDLLDYKDNETADRYIDKGLSLIGSKKDPWSMNRNAELLSIKAETYMRRNENEYALPLYNVAISICTELYNKQELEDLSVLVCALISKTDCERELMMTEDYLRDMTIAADYLEKMYSENNLPRPDLLVELHEGISRQLMSKGNIQEAEKHLMRVLQIGIDGAEDYIRNHGRPS